MKDDLQTDREKYEAQVKKLTDPTFKAPHLKETLATKATNNNNNNDQTSAEEAKPKLKLRNYTPHDKNFTEATAHAEKPVKIISEISNQLDTKLEQQAEAGELHIGIETLQPRKPDWDLKRDLNPKMKILNRQTQKTLGLMLRERLLAEKKMAKQTEELEKGENRRKRDREEIDKYKDMLPDKSAGTKFR